MNDIKMIVAAMEVASREKFSLSAWLKEKPVRRGRLVVWFSDQFGSPGGFDEMVTAMTAALGLLDAECEGMCDV